MEIEEYYRMARIEMDHWWYKSLHELISQKIEIYTQRSSNFKILDLGCGTGGLANDLTKFGKTIALDVSSLALRLLAKKKNHSIRVVQGSANSLPIISQSSDLITSISVIYHRNVDDRKSLREMHRVLNDDGIAIIVVPAFSWLYSTHDRAVHTRKRYDMTDLKNIVEQSGLEVVDGRYIFSFLFPIFLMKRLLERIRLVGNGPSDLFVPPKILNEILYRLCHWEWSFMKIVKLPFGSSIMLVARKK